MREIRVSSKKRCEMIDITASVQDVVEQEGLSHGCVLVYVPHTTAGVTINEGADPSVQHDIVTMLNSLIPASAGYHHMEGNSDAHIKASLIGSSVTVPVSDSKMRLGTWQHIFFFEGDGPRSRRVLIQPIYSGE